MDEVKYYFLNRPPSIGTHPPGENGREVWQPVKNIPGTQRHAHGWVRYPAPLLFEKIWQYELFPADKRELDDYFDWRHAVGK